MKDSDEERGSSDDSSESSSEYDRSRTGIDDSLPYGPLELKGFTFMVLCTVMCTSNDISKFSLNQVGK